MSVDNKDYIHALQVNISMSKDSNPHLKKEGRNLITQEIDEVKENLFAKIYDLVVYEESHHVTVNILGKFKPYKDDHRKRSDSMMKYPSTQEWMTGASKEIIEEAFKDHEVKIYIGINNYQKV